MTKDELSRRSEWERRDYKIVEERSGRLRIRTNRVGGNPRDFSDAEDAPIDSQLNDLMRWLYKHSITVSERDKRAETARLQAIEERRRADEEESVGRQAEERRRLERQRVDALIDKASKWQAAEELRAFIAAAQAAGRVETDWTDWAYGIADRLDPLTSTLRGGSERSLT